MSRNYRSIAEPKTLNGNVSNVATQITLNNVTGLPSPPYVLVINPDTANEEAVLVTTNQDGVTAPTLKVERAIETGATAKTHTDTNVVRHMIVGSDLQLVHDHIDNTSAHDATGGVVGRTKSQTLTNKTINLTDNTLSGTKAQFNTALSDADFATLAGTETLTNKTLTSPVITGGTVNGGATLTVDSTELNILDGVTSSAAELNILDGATLTTTELNYVDGVTSAIQTQLTNNTPVGVVNMWVTGTAPTGWLLCDGAAVSRTTYSALFAVIGTTYGAGDTTTTFNIPDLLGRVPMGAGTGTGLTARSLGTELGVESVTLTAAQSGSPSHDHGVTSVGGGAHTASGSISTGGHGHTLTMDYSGTASHDHAISGASNPLPAMESDGSGGNISNSNGTAIAGVGDLGGSASVSVANHSHDIDITVSTATAASEAHTNIQPSTVINFIIKH